MRVEKYVSALALPLPEDIMKRKWAGDFEGAAAAIDARLRDELPEALRARLECEKERLRRLPTQYPWNRAEAVKKLQELVPTATEADFDRLELAGWVDFIYVRGEKRYFVRFHKTLAKYPQWFGLAERVTPDNPWLDPMIETIKTRGELTRRITLRTSIAVDKAAFVPGEYVAHLPFPAPSAQQRDIRLIDGDPDGIAEEGAPARTAWWRRQLTQWQRFSMTYSYVSRVRYADPLGAPAPEAPLYPDALPPCPEDLAESGAYMRFTPYLRELAETLARGETTDAGRAWRFYEFATTKVKYSFMRDYFQIDNLGEYCAVNLKGDCGLQALLFILLCRIAGIPARWQSGMSIDSSYVGSHDWAQFYLPGWGWLFADPSFGGSAYRSGNAARHRFYFGNLDPMRMVANRAYQAELTPPKQALPFDPFDNQSGEVERVGAALPFTGRELDDSAELVGYETL